MVIFGRQAGSLGSRMAAQLGAEYVSIHRHYFSDGNLFVQVPGALSGRRVVIVQSLWGEQVNNDLMELLFAADAVWREGAAEIVAIVPYFSYGKSDKQDGPGTSIRSAVVGHMMASAHISRLITCELHNTSVTGFFPMPVMNLSVQETLVAAIGAWQLPAEEAVLVSPDAGFAKRAHELAGILGWPCVVADKNRPDHSERPQFWGVSGSLAGKQAVIVDDFTTSGGTLIQLAQLLAQQGAVSVRAAVTHAPVQAAASEKIQGSLLVKLVTTNTTLTADTGKIEVVDVSGVLAAAVSAL